MLRGRLRQDSGYLETWGTFKGLLEIWTLPDGLEVKGVVTDIVELHSYLLPSIARCYPDQEVYLGKITIPETCWEQELLKLEIRLYLEKNSSQMERVEPSRRG